MGKKRFQEFLDKAKTFSKLTRSSFAYNFYEVLGVDVFSEYDPKIKANLEDYLKTIKNPNLKQDVNAAKDCLKEIHLQLGNPDKKKKYDESLKIKLHNELKQIINTAASDGTLNASELDYLYTMGFKYKFSNSEIDDLIEEEKKLLKFKITEDEVSSSATSPKVNFPDFKNATNTQIFIAGIILYGIIVISVMLYLFFNYHFSVWSIIGLVFSIIGIIVGTIGLINYDLYNEGDDEVIEMMYYGFIPGGILLIVSSFTIFSLLASWYLTYFALKILTNFYPSKKLMWLSVPVASLLLFLIVFFSFSSLKTSEEYQASRLIEIAPISNTVLVMAELAAARPAAQCLLLWQRLAVINRPRIHQRFHAGLGP
ncbi:MAG: hypothetical protein R6U11_02175 [Bacteroidales bacterium]